MRDSQKSHFKKHLNSSIAFTEEKQNGEKQGNYTKRTINITEKEVYRI